MCVFGSSHTYQVVNGHQTITACTNQPYCDNGHAYSAHESHAKIRECTACATGKFLTKDQALLRAGACSPQHTCGTGTYISPESTVEKRVCFSCPDKTYQSQSNHVAMSCTHQPGCAQGERLASQLSKHVLRQCKECSTGQYQEAKKHYRLTCLQHSQCDADKNEFIFSNGTNIKDVECKSNVACTANQ